MAIQFVMEPGILHWRAINPCQSLIVKSWGKYHYKRTDPQLSCITRCMKLWGFGNCSNFLMACYRLTPCSICPWLCQSDSTLSTRLRLITSMPVKLQRTTCPRITHILPPPPASALAASPPAHHWAWDYFLESAHEITPLSWHHGAIHNTARGQPTENKNT